MWETFIKKMRIADKLFYGVMLLIVCVLGLLGSLIIHQRLNSVGRNLERNIGATANYLSQMLSRPAHQLNAKKMREVIEGAASNELLAVEIFNADNERVYIYERSGAGGAYDRKIEKELFYNDVPDGKMAAYFSISPYIQSLKLKELLRLVIMISASGLVFGAGLYFLVKKIVIQPIEETLQFSKGLAAGNYGKRMDVLSKDEMGEMQRSLNKMADELQEYVEELKSSFYEAEGARCQALAASRLKSEFLANMSHEIRTPVNAIVGFADILLEGEKDIERRENLKTIKKSAGMLLDNIGDILDFSKIEAGKLSLLKSEVLLADIVNEITPIIKLRLHGKEVSFDSKIDDSLLKPLLCDRIRIRQVLLNVLINSTKFTERGKISLNIYPNGSGIVFAIKDTGVGIPKEYHEKIFEPFLQVDGSMTREFSGVGLGLAIAKRLVEMMNGKIWIESEVGQGTTTFFTVVK